MSNIFFFIITTFCGRLSFANISTTQSNGHVTHTCETGIFFIRPMRLLQAYMLAAVASYGNYDEILGFLFQETSCLFVDGEIPTIEPLYKSHLLCCFLVLVMSLRAACLFIV